jgi:hypothetical protein
MLNAICKSRIGVLLGMPLLSQSQSHIVTDVRSVSKSWCRAPSGAHDQIFLTLLTVTVLFFVGRPLWQEDGSVFCICCWSLPAQSFLGPSPLVLATIFYCLRLETSSSPTRAEQSRAVAYCRQPASTVTLGIEPRWDPWPSIWFTRESQSQSHFTTDSQSVCLAWCWAPSGAAAVKVKVTLRLTVSQSVSLGVEPHLDLMTRYLLLFDSYVLHSVGRPLWREDGSVFCMCRCQRSLSRS